MDIFEIIEKRRSVAHLLPKSVERATIEKVLSAGLWAPNHKHAEPWRFFVFQNDARRELADAIMENFHRDNPHATPQELEKAQNKNPRRVTETPLVIVVTSNAGNNAVETHENYGACACAVQNMLLVAHALGLGAFWRTGDGAYTSPNAVKELLKLPESATIVAFLLMGYPDSVGKAATRKPLSEKVTWMD